MTESSGDRRGLFGFRFPSASELEDASPVEIDGSGRRRQVMRGGVLFLLSALLPVAVAVTVAVVLASQGAGLSDPQYFTLLFLVVLAMFLIVLQWRDVAIRLWPVEAVDYYSSTILNRLRSVETATEADLAYLRVVMPDLEKILMGGLLARRLAGTSLAREQFTAYHVRLGQQLGDCEVDLIRDRGPESTGRLRRLAASLLAGSWSRLPADDDAKAAESVGPADHPSIIRRAGNAFLDKSVDKVAEGAVAALIVLGGGIAWR